MNHMRAFSYNIWAITPFDNFSIHNLAMYPQLMRLDYLVIMLLGPLGYWSYWGLWGYWSAGAMARLGYQAIGLIGVMGRLERGGHFLNALRGVRSSLLFIGK